MKKNGELFIRLPNSIVLEILFLLSPEAIAIMALVDTNFLKLVYNNQFLWKEKYKQHYHFTAKYKLFNNKPRVNWYQLFKSTYKEEVRYTPNLDGIKRSLKFRSLIREGDLAQLKLFLREYPFKHYNLYLEPGTFNYYLCDYNFLDLLGCISLKKDQQILDYLFNSLILPNYVENEQLAPEKKDSLGDTLLQQAARFNQYELALDLIYKYKIKVNLNENGIQSPLHCASLYGHIKIVRLLLENGAEIEAVSRKGLTPLDHATITVLNDIEVIQCLLENGAKQTVNLGWVAHRGRLDVVNLLLKHNTNVNLMNNGVPLLYAMENQHFDVVLSLLQYGIKAVNIKKSSGGDLVGSTPLHFAAKNGHGQIIGILLGLGADPNLTDWRGNTSLHYAAEYGNKEYVQLMLAHQAKVDAKNSDEETALHKAVKYPDIVKLLIEYKASVNLTTRVYKPEGILQGKDTPLHLATKIMCVESMKYLLENGADVNAKEVNGFTPLHCAARIKNSGEGIKLLLSFGADIYAKTAFFFGKSPLFFAKQTGEHESIQLLENPQELSLGAKK